ncbi:MAG: hypothetical protein IKR17_02950 [Bacteroidales bacterium]|nr:hypothetical protein [Bacteroidales bacterium]
MNLKQISFLAIAASLCFIGCKEEGPSQTPTIPTTFGLEDGAEVTELTVTLSANGSTVEDENLSVSYIYYIGKSADALSKTSANVTLEPYTQYFWSAQAKTEGGESAMTEVRTLYCVPSIELTSDNGDGEWAAVIRWEKNDKIKSVTISATPDHEGYSLESLTVEGEQDSCYFKTTNPQNNAYTHSFDDKKGIYYEPVIYTFNAKVHIQVGDKLCTASGSINEVLLNKQLHVRDHEYNIYRVVKNGNQTWLADDLRATSFINGKGEIVKLEEGKDFVYSTLKSGAIGVLYRVSQWEVVIDDHTYMYERGNLFDVWQSLDKVQFAPNGYDIPTDDDFLIIERNYGLADVSLENRKYASPYYCIVDSLDVPDAPYIWTNLQKEFEGDDSGIMLFMASPYDWENVLEIPSQGWFNAKPFGASYDGDDVKNTQGKGACYLTKPIHRIDNENCFALRVFSNKHKGIARILSSQNSSSFISLRCIKK